MLKVQQMSRYFNSHKLHKGFNNGWTLHTSRFYGDVSISAVRGKDKIQTHVSYIFVFSVFSYIVSSLYYEFLTWLQFSWMNRSGRKISLIWYYMLKYTNLWLFPSFPTAKKTTYKPMTFFPVFGRQKKRHTNLWLFSQFSDCKKKRHSVGIFTPYTCLSEVRSVSWIWPFMIVRCSWIWGSLLNHQFLVTSCRPQLKTLFCYITHIHYMHNVYTYGITQDPWREEHVSALHRTSSLVCRW